MPLFKLKELTPLTLRAMARLVTSEIISKCDGNMMKGSGVKSEHGPGTFLVKRRRLIYTLSGGDVRVHYDGLCAEVDGAASDEMRHSVPFMTG